MNAGATRGRDARSASRDPWVWLNLGVLAASAALFVLPGLDHEWVILWSDWYAYIPVLLVAMGALLSGLRSVADRRERRFWMILAFAFALHLAVRLLYLVPVSVLEPGEYAAADVLYALYYLSVIVALHHRPDRPYERGERTLRGVESAATASFVALLFVYFIIVPETASPGAYATAVPSLLLYVSLDVFVFLTLLHMAATTPSPGWRRPLGLLAVAGGFWLVLDAYEASIYLEMTSWIGGDSVLNVLWYVPVVLVAVSARLRRSGQGEMQGSKATLLDVADTGEYRFLGTTIVYAVALPALHLVIGVTGLLGDDAHPLHDVVALGGLVVLLVFALAHQALQARVTRHLRQSESALREQRRLLAAAVEQAEDAIIVSGRDGAVVFANEAWGRAVAGAGDAGSAASPAPEQGTVPELLRRFDPEAERAWEAASTARSVTRVIERDRNGEKRHEVVTVTPVADPSGVATHRMTVIRDVTRQKLLEDQLRKLQRMESLGTMAGGIAHDFNNMLTGILGHADLLRHELPENDPGQEDLDAIVHAAMRARVLTGQILTFSRQDTGAPELVDVAEVVHATVALMEPSIPSDVQVHVETDPMEGGVWATKVRIEQVVLNLLTNALQAVGSEGGIRVTVREELVGSGDRSTGVIEGVRPGRHAVLAVEDDGVGIGPEALDRIFDPFFTTRGVGQGPGLGLSVAHGIVAGVGGEIVVESELDRGTTFRVLLPLRTGPPDRPASTAGEKGPARVLVVADDARLAADVRRCLDPSAYRIVAADGGGLEHFLRSPERFDAVLVDHRVAGMPGMSVAIRLRGLRARLPVVLVSDDPEPRGVGPLEGIHVAPRHGTPASMGDAIVRALRSRGGA